MSRLVENVLEQRGNVLKVQFHVTPKNIDCTETSREYLISCSSLFQVRVINLLTCVKFQKKRPNDNLTYINNFSSTVTDKSLVYLTSSDTSKAGVTFTTSKSFVSDEGTWHIIYEKSLNITLDITIRMDTVSSVSYLTALHGDTGLTDFELCGDDGSVQVHRAVLAASSPVFMTMLGGAWKETKEGCVEVPGTSVATLNHFKEFIYGKPLSESAVESGLEQLLLLAACYSMPELEQICVFRLVDTATSQNFSDLLDFAGKHNIKRLFAALFLGVKAGVLKVDEVCNHLLLGEIM